MLSSGVTCRPGTAFIQQYFAEILAVLHWEFSLEAVVITTKLPILVMIIILWDLCETEC